jgi:hypothetical protein
MLFKFFYEPPLLWDALPHLYITTQRCADFFSPSPSTYYFIKIKKVSRRDIQSRVRGFTRSHGKTQRIGRRPGIRNMRHRFTIG